MVPIPVGVDMYLGNSHEYIQVLVHYPYIAMPLDSYIPLTELHLKLCTQMAVLHYCENAHLLRHRSEHTCASHSLLSDGFGNKSIALQNKIYN